jgi:hypothetical protein
VETERHCSFEFSHPNKYCKPKREACAGVRKFHSSAKVYESGRGSRGTQARAEAWVG